MKNQKDRKVRFKEKNKLQRVNSNKFSKKLSKLMKK